MQDTILAQYDAQTAGITQLLSLMNNSFKSESHSENLTDILLQHHQNTNKLNGMLEKANL